MNSKEETAVRTSVRKMYERMHKKDCECPNCIQTLKNELSMNLVALKTKKQTKATIRELNEIQKKLDYFAAEDKKQEKCLSNVTRK